MVMRDERKPSGYQFWVLAFGTFQNSTKKLARPARPMMFRFSSPTHTTLTTDSYHTVLPATTETVGMHNEILGTSYADRVNLLVLPYRGVSGRHVMVELETPHSIRDVLKAEMLRMWSYAMFTQTNDLYNHQ